MLVRTNRIKFQRGSLCYGFKRSRKYAIEHKIRARAVKTAGFEGTGVEMYNFARYALYCQQIAICVDICLSGLEYMCLHNCLILSSFHICNLVFHICKLVSFQNGRPDAMQRMPLYRLPVVGLG